MKRMMFYRWMRGYAIGGWEMGNAVRKNEDIFLHRGSSDMKIAHKVNFFSSDSCRVALKSWKIKSKTFWGLKIYLILQFLISCLQTLLLLSYFELKYKTFNHSTSKLCFAWESGFSQLLFVIKCINVGWKTCSSETEHRNVLMQWSWHASWLFEWDK